MTFRFRLALLFILLGFLLVISRLFYWQVVKAKELSELGQLQYGRSVKILPKRGEIKTSDNFPIAANKLSYLVYANPKQAENKEQMAQVMGNLLNVDPASISASLSLDRVWVPIARNIDINKKNQVEKLNFPGVGFEESYVRFYPEASMAANLIGFVGKDDEGNDKGYFGLEGYYDRLLRGEEGVALQVNDAFGRPILAKMNKQANKTDGKNLILSMDRAIQFMVEKKLKEGIEKYGAESGMVGIMNPKTGEIIAMASFPTFDPREFYKYSVDLYKNSFISDLYEPGSTFKPLVMSAALDAKLVTPNTKCDICDKPVSIGGYEIKTWNNQYRKDINMIETIQHSDNTGMIFVALKLGLEKMLGYLNKFGIDSPTQIDLQGEVSSPFKPQENWYEVDVATTAFGQGISVTPLQLLTAIAAIANGGKKMEPHVVKAVEDISGNLVNIEPRIVSQPISENTAKVMTEIMVNAVSKGEANWARTKGYKVAGKTGTASIPIAGHYDPNQTIASFVGFAPVNDPKFVMLVIINRPKTSIYGAETAAPVFFNIAKSLFSYYGIPPDGE